ncbi:flagellar biosynthesis anti-sigma factor FlgM [Thermodesulfobacteriota bacterium]
MKIDETLSQPKPLEKPKKLTDREEGNAGKVDAGRGETDRLDLSRDSIEFGKVKELMERELPERSKKVSELKEKVKSGHYRVDASEIATKILTDALETKK